MYDAIERAPVPMRSAGGSLMAVLTLKGLHQVRKPLAGGREVWHVYAWRGGPKLLSSPRRIVAASPDLIAAYQAAHSKASAPEPTKSATLETLIAKWRASAEWAQLRPRTKEEYLLQVGKVLDGILREEHGRAPKIRELPLASVGDPRLRGILLSWRDQALADKPRTADKAMFMLSAAFAWGVERGLVAGNPLTNYQRIHNSDRSLIIWTADDIVAIKRHCSVEISWAIDLAAASGLALSDLIALPWSAWDGEVIDWRRKKTGRSILIPNHQSLREALAAIPRRSPVVLTNSLRKPWTVDSFGHAFGRARDAAGLAGKLRLHDLRGTAATHFVRSGLSYPQVAMIMGWDEKSVEAIAKRYVNRRNIVAAMVAKIAG